MNSISCKLLNNLTFQPYYTASLKIFTKAQHSLSTSRFTFTKLPSTYHIRFTEIPTHLFFTTVLKQNGPAVLSHLSMAFCLFNHRQLAQTLRTTVYFNRIAIFSLAIYKNFIAAFFILFNSLSSARSRESSLYERRQLLKVFSAIPTRLLHFYADVKAHCSDRGQSTK